jgi:hypothetical protein
MVINETYKEWLTFLKISGKVLVDKLEDTEEGLSIFLSFPSYSTFKGKKVQIRFDAYIAYRNMDESYRAKTFNETGGFKESLYLIEGSKWLRWLHDESVGIYQDNDIKHYTIITEADCVDILSEFPPEVIWVDKDLLD